MDRVLNNIILKDERHMHIVCMMAKLWSKDTYTENTKGFKKEKYYLSTFSELQKNYSLALNYQYIQDDKASYKIELS